MSDKHHIIEKKITRDFDLNLLEVFELVYFFESVNEAAKSLQRSSSAVSQSLNKLREHFSDPLFVRNGTKLVKTATAANVHAVINKNYIGLINNLHDLMLNNVRTKINIHCSPYCSIRILPFIMKFIEQENIDCSVNHHTFEYNSQNTNLDDQLSLRQVDLIFDINPIYRLDIQNTMITHESFCWVCSKTHPRIYDEITQEMFAQEGFVMFRPDGLKIKKFQESVQSLVGPRNNAFTTSSLFAAAAAVEQSELISVMPTWFFDKFSDAFSLKKLHSPNPLPEHHIHMISRKNSLKNEIIKKIMDGVIAEFAPNGTIENAN